MDVYKPGQVRQCLKCKSTYHYLFWVAAYGEGSEHMKVVCSECGYAWRMAIPEQDRDATK